jgi:hypothetical protein
MAKDTVKAARIPARDGTTQKHLPFSEIRDNVMILKDGSSRMVLRVSSVNFDLKSEEEQDALIGGYQRFLNSLRFPVQIIIRSLKADLEGYLAKLKGLAGNQKNPLLQEQTYRYIDFLIMLIDLAQIMRKEFYIVIPFEDGIDTSVRSTGTLNIIRSFWESITQEDSVATIRQNAQRISRLRKGNQERADQIIQALEGI